jgi:hypothetical protein
MQIATKDETGEHFGSTKLQVAASCHVLRVPKCVEPTKFYAISLWHEKADMEKYTKERFPKVKAMVEPFLTAPIIVKHCTVDETIPKKFIAAAMA